MKKMLLGVVALLFVLAPLEAFACNTDEDCAPGETCMGGICEGMCEPACEGKNCGPNQCGGECGYCLDGVPCVDGVCDCDPQCDGKQCGADGCGGFCGACDPGCNCVGGQCECCEKQCAGKNCGDDGCGGQCGSCQLGEECIDGQCTVPPECNHECDLDQIGCDGIKTWTCVADADDCRKKVMADCPEGQECEAGECVVPTPPVDEGGDEKDVVTAEDAATPGADVVGGMDSNSPTADGVVPTGDAIGTGDSAEPAVDVVAAADTGGTGEPAKKKSGCQAGAVPSPGAMLLLLLLVGILVPMRRRNAA